MVNTIDMSHLPFDDKIIRKLNTFVSVILSEVENCQKIVLFGSYARADYNATSDLDIMVLTKTEVPRELRGELCSFFDENNADLIFYTTDAFENSQVLLVQRIREEGILLWQH